MSIFCDSFDLQSIDKLKRWPKTLLPFPECHCEGKDNRIPLLKEVFEAFPQTPVNIDIKVNNSVLIKKVCNTFYCFPQPNHLELNSSHIMQRSGLICIWVTDCRGKSWVLQEAYWWSGGQCSFSWVRPESVPQYDAKEGTLDCLFFFRGCTKGRFWYLAPSYH